MSDHNDEYQRPPPREYQHDKPQYQPKPQYQSNGGGNNYFSGGGGSKSYSNRGGGGGGYQNNRQNQEPFDEANVRLYKAYAGTGNRDAPADILNTMKRLARELEEFGYVLRVGGMDGPEDAFEAGARNSELHLPWQNFNNRQSKSYFNTDEIKCIAKMFHPTYDGLKPAIQAFLCKNVRQVLGKDLRSPVRFVLLWSEDGAESSARCNSKTGSAGHVISLAAAMKIPVFNLGTPDAEARLKFYLEIASKQPESQYAEFSTDDENT